MSAVEPRERHVKVVDVEPTSNDRDRAVVTFDGAVRIVCDHADVDGSDNLTLYRDAESVCHAKVLGVPLDVPNLVRRAIKYGEHGSWGDPQ